MNKEMQRDIFNGLAKIWDEKHQNSNCVDDCVLEDQDFYDAIENWININFIAKRDLRKLLKKHRLKIVEHTYVLRLGDVFISSDEIEDILAENKKL